MKKISLTFLSFLLVMLLTGCQCKHEWVDATCEAPKTCAKCSETEGEALGHKWLAATCEDPKYCSVCGKVEGEPMSHTWVDATCTEAKYCSACKAAEGEPLGHTWVDATCETAKFCSACKIVDGEPVDHRPEDWTHRLDFISASASSSIKCVYCGKLMEYKHYEINKLHRNGKFQLSSEEFLKRLDFFVRPHEMNFQFEHYVTEDIPEDETAVCTIYHNHEPVAWMVFGNPDDLISESEWETTMIGYVCLSVYDPDYLLDLAAFVAQACDPTIKTHDDALTFVTNIVTNSGGKKEYNGLQYITSYENQFGAFMLEVFVENS